MRIARTTKYDGKDVVDLQSLCGAAGRAHPVLSFENSDQFICGNPAAVVSLSGLSHHALGFSENAPSLRIDRLPLLDVLRRFAGVFGSPAPVAIKVALGKLGILSRAVFDILRGIFEFPRAISCIAFRAVVFAPSTGFFIVSAPEARGFSALSGIFLPIAFGMTSKTLVGSDQAFGNMAANTGASCKVSLKAKLSRFISAYVFHTIPHNSRLAAG